MDFEGLNTAQKQAVTQIDGPIMVLAGAGSGKTRTLVARIIHLLEEHQISPFRVLALTFSNKAAREMRERVASVVNLDIGALKITTFHSFCANVLRSEATYLGLSRNFTIYDDSEAKAVVKTLLKKHGVSTKDTSPYEILYYIDDIKNNGHYLGRAVDDDEYEVDSSDEYYTYYQEYEAELRKANAIDFGGLITAVIELFETYPDVLRVYQNRFQYLLVDEYQDTNRAQFMLLKMLCEKRKNICVVGDEDQSIYSWRGADIRNILDFEKLFPAVEVIKLEQNYRSSKNIIEAASHVISRNELRKGKNMWTDNSDGDVIEIVECSSDKKESEFIATEINRLRKAGESYGDMAVFYRTNSQSRLIEDNLRKYKIPYRVVGGLKFYDRKEIKDLLAYIRVVVNGKDSLAISRIINVPSRGIGATTMRKLEQAAIEKDCSFWELIDDYVSNPDNHSSLKISAKVRSAISEFVTVINEVKLLEQEEALPSVLYDKLLHESGYWSYLKTRKDYESLARLENLEELHNAIKQFEVDKEKPTLLGFLETMTLDTTANDESDQDGRLLGEVSLMTVHGAKGLEFPYVFVAGAEENIFPSYRSMDEGEHGVEEERRLFYVAMTRAMKKLYIMFAQGRMLFGQLKFNGPSRYIAEIPDHYFSWKKYGDAGGQPRVTNNYNGRNSWDSDDDDALCYDVSYDDNEVTYQVNASRSKSTFQKGSAIRHGLYGEGIVLESEGAGPNEKVVVKFCDGTKKKFMVKFAPLKSLS